MLCCHPKNICVYNVILAYQKANKLSITKLYFFIQNPIYIEQKRVIIRRLLNDVSFKDNSNIFIFFFIYRINYCEFIKENSK